MKIDYELCAHPELAEAIVKQVGGLYPFLDIHLYLITNDRLDSSDYRGFTSAKSRMSFFDANFEKFVAFERVAIQLPEFSVLLFEAKRTRDSELVRVVLSNILRNVASDIILSGAIKW